MRKITLENGLRVILEENASLRSANLSVWAASGSRFENAENNGISHFIEHMVFKGTETMTAFDIASRADEIGAQMNAFTTKEYTCFYIRTLSERISEGADILFDMLTHPRFDENDLATERGVVLEEIAMVEDDPSDVCFGLLEKTLMPEHPLGMEILGTRESVGRLTAKDLREHMRRFYAPERLVIGISGRFDEKTILRKIDEYFADRKNTGFPASYGEVETKTGFCTLKRHFEQSQFMLAFPAVGSESPLRFPLQVIVTMLGSSSSSRLNQRIREQLGLVYSVDAWLSQAIGSGFLGVGLALTPAKEDEALRETCTILRDFSSTLTQKELDIAKQKVKSNLLMSRELPHSGLSANGYTVITRDCFTSDEEIIEGIDSLTLAQAKRLCEEFLDPKQLCFAACGKVKAASHYRKIIEENF